MKFDRFLLILFISALLILLYHLEGSSSMKGMDILLLSSILALAANYMKSFHPKLHKPLMISGSFIVALYAMITLGEDSSLSYLLYLFPLALSTLAYGLRGGLSVYLLSLISLYLRTSYYGMDLEQFQSTSFILGVSTLGIIYSATELRLLIDKNERWLLKLHMKINEMSLLRDITISMQSAADITRLNKIVLTALTAGYGLGFNRACLFLVDGDVVTGEYAIGPSSRSEAYRIWGKVVTSRVTLHEVMAGHEEIDETLVDMVKKARFSLMEDQDNPIVKCCLNKTPSLVTGGNSEAFGDIMERLQFENYALVPMISKNRVVGVFLVDNLYNEKPITDDDLDALMTFSGQSALAFENILLYDQIRTLAITDELTKIYNHRQYKDSVAKYIREKTPFSLMVIDVDDFKQFNEHYGHCTGDRVLSEVGMALKNAVGAQGFAYRYGGDEFTLIMPRASREAALEVAKTIQDTICRIALEAVDNPLTLSIGLAEYPKDAQDEEELFILADKKLKFSKDSGKNAITWEVTKCS